MRGLVGKGVVVTGAARGIGFEVARRFLSEGSRVFLCDRDSQGLAEALSQLSREGEVGSAVCDVGHEDQVESMAAAAGDFLGRVDVLVNNAGVAAIAPVLRETTSEWDEILRVNLRGCFLVARVIGASMAQSGGGAIVNMSSTNGLVAEVGYAAYNASKAGLLLLSQTMAVELAPLGVRVNCVCPGYIVTPMSKQLDDPAFVRAYVRDNIPLGRTGTPGDVASAVVFLASEESAFITGTSLVVDGGQLSHSGAHWSPGWARQEAGS
jgi:NAD(P)-dependent dehydrogenase (short-subunit alcohol dehydrogenase family)